MLYTTPKNLLQEKLNQALDKGEETIISDLMKLSLLKKAEKNPDDLIFTEIYNLLGLEDFSNLVSLIDGRPIVFPSKEDLKDSLMLVLAYYYRNLEKKSWNEIKELLGLPDINSVKLGIQSSQFEKFLQKMMKRLKPFAEER